MFMLKKGSLLTLFKEYYSKASLEVDSIPRREFAFMTWDGRMIRHQAHNNEESILEFAQQRAPKAIYASLSKYLDPSHRLPKNVDRKTVNCQECGESYKADGNNPPCPSCGVQNEKADINTKDRRAMTLAFDIDYGDIPGHTKRSPKENLGAAARSTINLVNLLTKDLGFDQQSIHITFSGQKGFHIRVATENHPLFSHHAATDEFVRKTLINYVSGYSFKPMDFLLVTAHAHSANTWHLKNYSSGWGKRFNESIEYIIKMAFGDDETFRSVLEMYMPWHEDKERKGTKKSLPSAKVIEGFKSACVKHGESILKGHNIREMGDANATRLMSFALARARLRYASFVDSKVTADKARVLRIPGSIHGGSGMVCCTVPSVEHLNDMSWILDLQAELLGDEEVEVSISKVANTLYGVYEPGEHKVPKNVAISMLCKQ